VSRIGSQSVLTPGSRRRCPRCSARLYGAHNMGRPATITWVCRSCGYLRGKFGSREPGPIPPYVFAKVPGNGNQ
jgi:ribosomal protein S27AE